MSINNSLTIGGILAKTIPFFKEKEIPNPRLEADLMLGFVLGFSRVKLYADWDRPLNPDEVQRYREIIVRRIQGCPLAYLVGKKSFLSWDFVVNPAVLIPRPETEELVEAVVVELQGKKPLNGVDIGTGSGAIVISLAKSLPDSQWDAVDLSAEALEVAQLNARNLEVADRIRFLQGDLLEPLRGASTKYDVIVSNPPYIPSDEIAGLQPEVRQEPVLALDGGADGLDVYRKMLPQMDALLAENGLIALEHGYDQRQALVAMFEATGYHCKALQDLAGLDRMLLARKK